MPLCKLEDGENFMLWLIGFEVDLPGEIAGRNVDRVQAGNVIRIQPDFGLSKIEEGADQMDGIVAAGIKRLSRCEPNSIGRRARRRR